MMIERRDRKKGMPRNLVPLKIQTRLYSYQVSKLLELFAQVNGIKTEARIISSPRFSSFQSDSVLGAVTLH